ncbi:SDR family oxidoreductase [Vibrio splendidus]|nr:SDR family oxidoreductase [Vibrio splendidus]
MNILVTGASGFVGAKLLERLDSSLVKVLGRGLPVNFPQSHFYQLNIGKSTNYAEALCDVDTVVHLAARVHVMKDTAVMPLEEYREVNTHGTINLAQQAVRAGVKRFIFVSSIKVLGESTHLNSPFTHDDDHSPEDDYGLSKSEAEIELFKLSEDTDMEIVVIRPTLVYGPGVKANFASLLNLVSKGIPLPFGCITDNRRSLVSVINLVDLIITCIDHPKAANQTFLVSDDNDVSTSDMVALMAKALDKSQWQPPVPKCCYRLMGKLISKQAMVDRLLGSLQVDINHTKETLDWTPPQSLEDGIKEAALAFYNSQRK